MAGHRTRLTGMTRFHDEGTGRELVNTMRIEIAGERTETVVGCTLDPERSEAVASTHPAVIGHQRGVTDLMRKTAYANRPIESLWVPKPRRRRNHVPDVCAECLGLLEVMIGDNEDARLVPCPVCGEA